MPLGSEGEPINLEFRENDSKEDEEDNQVKNYIYHHFY